MGNTRIKRTKNSPIKSGQPLDGRQNTSKHITPGTIFIPLLFMALHILVQSMVIGGYATLNLARQAALGEIKRGQAISVDLSQINLAYAFLIAMPISIGVYCLGIYLLRARYQPYVYWQRPRVSDALRVLPIMAGCVGLSGLILLLFQYLGRFQPFFTRVLKQYEEMSQKLEVSGNLYLQILVFVLLVPLAEELLFRGIIMGELRRALPDWAAIVVCGVLFALFHFDYVQSAYVLVAGLAISAIYVWGQSFWLAWLAHAFFNFCGSSLLQIAGGNSGTEQTLNLLFMICIPLGLIALTASGLKRRSGKEKPANVFR